MSRKTVLTIIATLLAITAAFGASSALAINDLSSSYASVLRKNAYLINNSLLSETLTTKLIDSGPSKSPWYSSVSQYFDKKTQLNSVQASADEEYNKQVQEVRNQLQTKLNQAYNYLKDHPDSGASSVLENTTAVINEQLSNSNSPLDVLADNLVLLNENSEFFTIVVAYEARKQYFVDIKSLASSVAGLQLRSSNNNNVGLSEIQSVATLLTERITQENNTSFNTSEAVLQLSEIKSRLASVEQAISAESDKILAELKAQEEENKRLAEEKARKEEEARKYAELYKSSYKRVVIDIGDQTMYQYEGGSIIGSTGIVTGKLGYWDTPRGNFAVQTKQRNIVLNSPFVGISYSYPVSYWMQFADGGFGIHDAYTRSEFGGSIYTYNGSHGCVNTPFDFVSQLYNWAEIGTPVSVID
jgi:lipoprotein-anchoring transpeptidase ErfK/SrfK